MSGTAAGSAATVRVRVVRYRMCNSEVPFILVTTLLDPEQASANELAALHHERREIGTACGEVRTRMPGPGACCETRPGNSRLNSRVPLRP